MGARARFRVWLPLLGMLVAGFGVGYAVVALSGPDPAPRERVRRPDDAGATGGAARAEREEPGGEGARADATGRGGRPTRDGASVPADESTSGPPVIGGRDVAVATGAELAAAASKPWWERCYGRTCALDFHALEGGLVVREGGIEHGERVAWQDRFADAPRVGVLPTRDGLRVHVAGVAMDPEGEEPVAARVIWERDDEGVEGVIALDLGAPTKRVTMSVPDEARERGAEARERGAEARERGAP